MIEATKKMSRMTMMMTMTKKKRKKMKRKAKKKWNRCQQEQQAATGNPSESRLHALQSREFRPAHLPLAKVVTTSRSGQ